LKLELSTRTAELDASELRLENMEKDLVEVSLANETYRSQVMTGHTVKHKEKKLQMPVFFNFSPRGKVGPKG
jgi:hypothetical protein